MPSRIGPAGTCRVAIQGNFFGQTVVNVFWVQLTVSGSMTQSVLDAWTLAFGNAYNTNIMPRANGNYHTTSVASTFFVDGTNTNVMSSQQAITGAGGSGVSSEAELSVVLSWNTTAYWRGGKPRSYIPASHVNADASVNSRWSATFITGTITAAQNFLTAINALTGGSIITATKLGIVSFESALTTRVPPIFLPFVGVKVHPRIGTQRRRKGKWQA